MGKSMEKRAAGCGLALALLFCLGVMAGAEGLKPAEKTERKPLYQREEYALYAGLPQEEMEKVTLAKLPPADDLWAVVNDAHPAQPGEQCSLRGMVGSFLPVEGDVMLREEVIYALCDMALDYPLAEGILIIRGGVTEEEQAAWQKEAMARYEKVGKRPEEALAVVPAAGASEHQTGWAMDIRLTGPLQMGKKNPLLRNAAGRWLQENMGRYGFVCEGETCEAIHLRYVGKSMAKLMQTTDLGLKEVLDLAAKEKAVTLERNGRVILCVQQVDGQAQALIPAGMMTRLSTDNRGHTYLCATAE